MTARISLLIACLLSPFAYALEYRIDVEEPLLFNVEDAIQNVIVRAAENLTGIPVTQMTTDAPDLFSLFEALVNSYGYDGDTLIVDIDVEGLKTRLETAGIELWDSERPKLLIWAAEERGLERLMVGPESNVIVDRLLAAGERFGVPMQRPLMDLEDTLALSPAEIWGEFAGAVTNASARYGLRNILVIGDRPARQALKYWLYDSSGDFRSGDLSGADEDERANTLIEVVMSYARAVSEPSAAVSSPAFVSRDNVPLASLQPQNDLISGQWTVNVEYVDMIRLMELIDHMEVSESVLIQSIQVRATEASIVLKTDLPLDATDNLISSFGTIQFISPLVYSLK